MNRMILFLMLSLILLLSSNIFALPISYSNDYKGQTSTVNLGQIGFDPNSVGTISERFLRPTVSNAYLTDIEIIGTTGLPSETDDGGQYDTPAIPEPTTIVLFGLGMAGIALRRRKL
ncbi:MAG: PEP-CTERM sorting domain-containing protein [Candidatus Zixiibacteriota bacterium]